MVGQMALSARMEPGTRTSVGSCSVRAARWWPGVLVTLAFSAALVAGLAGSVAPAHQRHETPRPSVGAPAAVQALDDTADDSGPGPTIEIGALLVVFVAITGSRRAAAWRMHEVDDVDSSRPFRHGDEPCRAPPRAAIA